MGFSYTFKGITLINLILMMKVIQMLFVGLISFNGFHYCRYKSFFFMT